jgi:hypothetical protein
MLFASSSAVAKSCAERDGFDFFFARFAGEQMFREERISFPLRAFVGSPSEGQRKERWSKDELASHFNPPVTKKQLQAEGLIEETRRLSTGEVEVEQSIPSSDSYNVTYRFKLKSGCWFLVYYEHSSY